jgi:rhodanese-related sulfurtransferase
MLERFLLTALAFLMLFHPGSALAKDAKKARNISVLEAIQMLEQDSRATFLVDVRTRWEYTLLGHPAKAYNIPWRFATTDFQVKGGPYQGGKAPFTGYQLSGVVNPDFVGVAKSLFKPEDKLVIISAKGDQGAEAADALVKAGFRHVFNTKHGFFGDDLAPEDQKNLAEKFSPYWQRPGRVNGWVYWGLPVSHQIDPRYVYPPDLKKMQSQD